MSRFHSESVVKREATGKTRQITTSHKSVMSPKIVSECQKWPKKFNFLIKNHKGCESFPFRIYRQTKSHRQDKTRQIITSHKSVKTPKIVSECQKWPKKFNFLIENHKGFESFPFRIYRQTRSHRQDKADNNFT